jgi:hypothetical protein
VNIHIVPIVGCILTIAISPSLAADAPAQLFGKTLTVSYRASAPIIWHDRPIVASKSSSLRIYISSAGRIFERAAQVAAGSGAALARDNEPGKSGWRFVGGKLVRSLPTVSGAFMQEISFDSTFASCTFFEIAGHESGKAYKWKGLDGKEYQATGPVTFAGQSCSISAGNGL